MGVRARPEVYLVERRKGELDSLQMFGHVVKIQDGDYQVGGGSILRCCQRSQRFQRPQRTLPRGHTGREKASENIIWRNSTHTLDGTFWLAPLNAATETK